MPSLLRFLPIPSSLFKRTVLSITCSLPFTLFASDNSLSGCSQSAAGQGKVSCSAEARANTRSANLFYGMPVRKEHLNYLNELLNWVDDNGLSRGQYQAAQKFWAELTEREQEVLAMLDDPRSEAPEDGSLLLFFLNHHDDALAGRLRQSLDLPASGIDKHDFARLLPVTDDVYVQNSEQSLFDIPIEGRLDSGGNLYNFTKYAQLDPGWSTSLAYYLGYRMGHITLAPVADPVTVDLSDRGDMSVLVVGDWGTGYWDDGGNPSPAQQVMVSMQNHPADLTIHLGDEYYAGTRRTIDGSPGEEAFNFTSIWNPGTEFSFALGSNHGMYDAENGLRYITLNSPKFNAQQQATTFGILLQDWVIVGLDTARYDTSDLFLKGALNEAQGEFLQKMGQLGKKVMVVTHHNGLTLDGSRQNNPLWGQVKQYLGREPDYWIWAHIHQGAAYSDKSAAGNTVARCWGHGAIPVGRASVMYQSDGSLVPEVDFYSDTPYPDPDREQELRILNGYGLLNFSGTTVTEQMYDQHGNLQWHDTLTFD